MKETFENYLERLKKRRSEDGYKYTDADFEKYKEYIRECWLTNPARLQMFRIYVF